MAQFNWAYISCSEGGSGGQAAGPTGSLQYLTGTNSTSGSANLIYYTSSYGPYSASTLVLTGALFVDGPIVANSYTIVDVSTIESSGSTNFGNTTDDTHVFTGSVFVGPSGSSPVFQVDVNTSQTIIKGIRVNYRNVSVSGLTSSTDDYIIGFGGSGALEFRIMSASVSGEGSIILLKDELSSRSGGITLSASTGETIDGASYYEITGTSPAISLYSNGTNWFVF